MITKHRHSSCSMKHKADFFPTLKQLADNSGCASRNIYWLVRNSESATALKFIMLKF